MWDLTIHPPSGFNALADTHSLLQSIWDPLFHPPSGPSVLAGTPSHVHPLWDSTSSLAHRSMSDFDTICNDPSPPLADLVLFGLPLKVFKTCLLGRGFHTLIKNVSFSSPTDVRSHRIHMHNLFDCKKETNKLRHCFFQLEGPVSQPDEPTEAD